MINDIQDKIHYCRTCKEHVDDKNTDQVIKHQEHKLVIIEPFDIRSNGFTSLFCFKCDKQTSTKFSELEEHELHLNCVGKDNRTQKEIQEYIKTNIRNEKTNATNSTDQENNPSNLEYAKMVLAKEYIKTLEDTNEIHYYHNGRYVIDSKNIKIKKILLEINPELTIHEQNEIIDKIKVLTYVMRDQFDVHEFERCFKNKIINIATGEVFDHSPDRLFLEQIPRIYNPKVISKIFTNALRKWLPLPDDYIDQLEAFATGLLKNTPKLEALYFESGEGDNGKSTFFHIMNRFFGKENYSTISIHDLLTDRFSRIHLEFKSINTFPDIESEGIESLDQLKPIVSGDEIQAGHKYQISHSMKNHAKLFFSANELPPIEKKTFATYKRIRVTEWTQTWLNIDMYNQARQKIKEKYPEMTETELELELSANGKYLKNRQFVESVTSSEDELSGILNLLLIVIRHLIKRDRFYNEYTQEQTIAKYSKNSTAIETFKNECTIQDSKAYVVKSQVYSIYYSYCKNIGMPPLDPTKFHPDFKKTLTGTQVEERRKRINGHEERVYFGLSWNLNHSVVKKYRIKNQREPELPKDRTLF